MGGHVAGERQALAARGAHQRHAGCAGQAHQVHARAGGALQFENRVQRQRLGLHRHLGQAQPRRIGAGRGHAVAAHPGVQGPQPQCQPEGARVLHGAPQHPGIGHRQAGLGKGHAAGLGQGGHLAEPFAAQALGQGAQRVQLCLAGLVRAVAQHFHPARLVQRRVGIRRHDQPGHAAGQRSLHFAGQRREPGAVHARRQVHQARQHGQPARVDVLLRLEARRRLADGGDAAVRQVKVGAGVGAAGRIDQPAAGDAYRAHRHGRTPATRLMAAMRTAMPNVTWSSITAWPLSATSEAISTPRFIGPGCITMASGRASARRACVRP
ncbi:Uncharacterised protein [Bordetella pertussis]|nr:Uncharacterised protein [Bordetella pertussis]CFM19888.1 Uncharacterised protein [Bordetella pertussis]CFP36126.1 Uncharacterised protein [Bordetella pertussis]CFU51227.1 Uncharacterised protein [Bordetella pertussis]CFU52798.1 Uncharacterised protein [Bordetella pertussis]